MKRIFFITFFMVSQLYTQISQGGKPHYLKNLDILPTIKTKLDDKLLIIIKKRTKIVITVIIIRTKS